MIDNKELIRIAIKNKKNSYSPYSNFRVSSVVLTKKGNIYKGVNIENSSFSVTLCAERSAISQAISCGEKEFEKIVIVGDSEYTNPCGVCRQFMQEFFKKETEIIIAKDENNYKVFNIDDLLPNNFSKHDLEEK